MRRRKNVTNPDIPELTKRRSARNAEEEGLSLYKPVVSLTERQKRFVRFMPVMKPEWSARLLSWPEAGFAINKEGKQHYEP
jgi:hypothetical protein